jgi:hypothetical protein
MFVLTSSHPCLTVLNLRKALQKRKKLKMQNEVGCSYKSELTHSTGSFLGSLVAHPVVICSALVDHDRLCSVLMIGHRTTLC